MGWKRGIEFRVKMHRGWRHGFSPGKIQGWGFDFVRLAKMGSRGRGSGRKFLMGDFGMHGI